MEMGGEFIENLQAGIPLHN